MAKSKSVANEQDIPHLIFSKEPLGLPASEFSFGYCTYQHRHYFHLIINENSTVDHALLLAIIFTFSTSVALTRICYYKPL